MKTLFTLHQKLLSQSLLTGFHFYLMIIKISFPANEGPTPNTFSVSQSHRVYVWLPFFFFVELGVLIAVRDRKTGDVLAQERLHDPCKDIG